MKWKASWLLGGLALAALALPKKVTPKPPAKPNPSGGETLPPPIGLDELKRRQQTQQNIKAAMKQLKENTAKIVEIMSAPDYSSWPEWLTVGIVGTVIALFVGKKALKVAQEVPSTLPPAARQVAIQQEARVVVNEVAEAAAGRTNVVAISMRPPALQAAVNNFYDMHQGLIDRDAAEMLYLSFERDYRGYIEFLQGRFRRDAVRDPGNATLLSLQEQVLRDLRQLGPRWSQLYANAPEVQLTQEMVQEFERRGFTVIPEEIARSGVPAGVDPRQLEEALFGGETGL